MKRVPHKMMKKALQIMLSQQLKGGDVYVIKDLSSIKDGKTKEMETLLSDMKLTGKKIMVLVDDNLENVSLVRSAARNISKVEIQRATDVHPYEVANIDSLVITQVAVTELEKRLT